MGFLNFSSKRARTEAPGAIPRGAWIGGILLLLAHLGWLFVSDLRGHPLAFYGLFALALAGWIYGARAWADVDSPSWRWLFAVAVGLRLLLLWVPPTLSDDVYRYIWDGRVFAAGLDPYELPPDADELIFLRDDLWKSLPHRDVATVYPPLSLALFSIAARSAEPLLTIKSGLIAADLIACWLLWRLAGRRGRPRGRVAWYAWNPLVTLEVAGMAHIDALGIPFLVLTWWWLTSPSARRRSLSALAAAGPVLVKLVPLLCVPLWARASRLPVRYVATTGLLCAVVALPIMARNGLPSGLVRYGVSWEFNGPLYEPLWRVLEAIRTPGWIEAALDGLKDSTGAHEFWNRFYPLNYARLHAKLILAGLLGLAVLRSLRESDVVQGTGRLFGAIVLLSATVYPWYLLWVLPWAALDRRLSWLVLSATLPLSYLPQVTDLPLMPWIFLAIWAPYLILSWVEWRRHV